MQVETLYQVRRSKISSYLAVLAKRVGCAGCSEVVVRDRGPSGCTSLCDGRPRESTAELPRKHLGRDSFFLKGEWRGGLESEVTVLA